MFIKGLYVNPPGVKMSLYNLGAQNQNDRIRPTKGHPIKIPIMMPNRARIPQRARSELYRGFERQFIFSTLSATIIDHQKVIPKCPSLGKLKVYDFDPSTPVIPKHSQKSIG